MPTRREFLQQTAAASVVAATAVQATEVTAAASKKSRSGPLKLAIVGTGEISPRYLKQAVSGTAAGERMRFVATCARTIESAKARAVEYGIDAWFDDYKKMYDTVKPDAVVIATPHTLHAEQSIAALERGIHVVVEKPMATRWEDCQAMVAAAQKSGKVLLALPYDATAPFRDTLPYVNELTLGVFTGAEAQAFLPGGARDEGYDGARGEGAMLSVLVYPVSRLINLLGPASRVTGFVNTLIPQRLLGAGKTVDVVPPARDSRRRVKSTTDDNVTLVIEWSSGQQAIVRCLWGTSILRIYDTTIYGRHGTLWVNGFMGNDVIIHSPEKAISAAEPVSWGNYKNCYRVPVNPLKDLKDDGLLEHFADCLEGRAQPTCGGQQQLHVHEILFKGFEASRTGRTQELTTTFIPWHKIDPAFHDTRSQFI